MPKKKRPAETIKLDGLTSESMKEFEPKEDTSKDDLLWETYFRGGPNLTQLPQTQDNALEAPQKTAQLTEKTVQIAPVATGVHTGVLTPVRTPVIHQSQDPKPKERKPPEEYVSLDATHTHTEAKIYSVIYRETVSKVNEPQHFGALRLMKLTGIGSDKTVRKAISGLIAKMSIIMVDPCPNHPLGPIYTAFPPKEVLAARKKAGIKIHPQTKKITTLDDPTGVGTGVYTTVTTPVKTTGVTPVESTPVTPVKTTGVHQNIPYIYKNYLNKDDSINQIESSSKSSSNKDDDTDDVFIHRTYIITLYENYTGNQWRVGDDEFYEGENLKNILPEVIEAAIIASVLRSKTKINSFAYCKGTIEEFHESLPPGYLSHLRKEWRKAKSQEINEKEGIETETSPILLSLPKNSYFEEGWLKNYISGFTKEEQPRIKRLAEGFDHFMITAREKKEWVKNPTGTFIGLVRGEVNVRISKHAPTFEERIAEERGIEEEEKVREHERLEWERERKELEQRKAEIEKEIREAMSQLSNEDLGRFIIGARKKYGVKALESDESIIERVPDLIINELYEREEEDWRIIWEEIDKIVS